MTETTGDYSESGEPSIDFVRDKIEGRYATALGGTELAEGTPEAADVDKQFTEREKAGTDRLEEIRRAMRGE